MWTHCGPEIIVGTLWSWNELEDIVFAFKKEENPKRQIVKPASGQPSFK